MNEEISLNTKERKEVENILRPKLKLIKVSYSIDGIIRRWTRFVADVELGYPLSVWDYVNELDWRDSLDDLSNAVSEPIRLKITEVLRPWDERFWTATRAISMPLRPGGASPRWYRIPVILKDPFKRDLEVEGFV